MRNGAGSTENWNKSLGVPGYLVPDSPLKSPTSTFPPTNLNNTAVISFQAPLPSYNRIQTTVVRNLTGLPNIRDNAPGTEDEKGWGIRDSRVSSDATGGGNPTWLRNFKWRSAGLGFLLVDERWGREQRCWWQNEEHGRSVDRILSCNIQFGQNASTSSSNGAVCTRHATRKWPPISIEVRAFPHSLRATLSSRHHLQFRPWIQTPDMNLKKIPSPCLMRPSKL